MKEAATQAAPDALQIVAEMQQSSEIEAAGQVFN